MNEATQRVASFSPARYAERLGLLDEPRAAGVHHRAVMLLADVSGFTALADRLSQTYRDAAERLTHILNDCFGRLIDRIDEYGGTIVTFVGDALIASWPQAEGIGGDGGHAAGVADDEVAAAIECARCMQSELAHFDAGPGAKLEVKVALALGTVTAARVGGYAGKWRIVAGGDAVAQLADAIGCCAPGDIVVSAAVAAAAGQIAAGRLLDDGRVCLDRREPRARTVPTSQHASRTTSIDRQVLRGFVADPVLHRLDANQEGGWLCDIRDVTCLFLRVDAIDWGSSDAWIRLQTALVPIQKRLAQFEGALDQVLVDEKGTIVVGAFGLPPATVDRREQRALAAAVAMAADMREQGLICDVGVATGRAFCGPIGNQRRRGYTLIGRPINLAARLMQKADGGVLCDEATYAKAGAVAPARSATTIELKGFADPVIVYSIGPAAERPTEQPEQTAATVGRRDEIAAVDALLDRLLDGRGGVLVFEGDAGIGKSRIATEAATRAAERGIRCLRSAGQAIEASSPWHAWRSVFGDLLAVSADASPAERAGRLAAGLGRYGGQLDLMPVLNPVFGLDLPDTDHTHPMVGESRARAARALLLTVLQRAAGAGPLAILVDDAHWLDSASWSLLADASRAGAAISIFVFTRPIAERSDTVAEVFAAAGDGVHTLAGLDRNQIESLLERQVGRIGLEGPLVEWIFERGEGNPYLTQELAYALEEADIFNRSAPLSDPIMESRLASLALPRSVEQIVALRIDGLDAADQLTLKAASVIGATFSLDMLESIHPVERDARRLGEIAENLVRAHMIAPEPGVAELVYSFRHRITQEGAYAMIPGEQRRMLHERIAREIEHRHAPALSPYLSLLAHHWTAAEVDDQALDYLEAAGAQALAGGAYLEAYRMFTAAVTRGEAPGVDAMLADADRRAAWHRNLAETHYGLGNVQENVAECLRTLELLGWHVPTSRIAAMPTLMRHSASFAVRSLLPAFFPKAVSANERKRIELAATAAHRMANAVYTETDPLRTVLGSVMAAAIATRTEAFVNSARCYSGIAILLGVSRISKPADAIFDRCIETAETLNDLDGLVFALYSRALVGAGVGGRWEQVERDVQRAAELGERLGDVQEQEITWIIASGSRTLQGDFEGGYVAAQRLLDSALRRRQHQHAAWAYDMQCWARCRQGRFDEAAEREAHLFALLPKVMNDGLSRMQGALSAVYLPAFLGDYDRAVSHLDEAVRAIEAFSTLLWAETLPYDHFGDALEVLLAQAGGSADEQRLARAQRAYQKRLAWHARRVPNATAVALLHKGRAALRAGRRSKATRLALAALRHATRLDMPFDGARACLLLAEIDGGESEAAKSQLEQARTVFERCGAREYLRRVRSLAG